MESAVNPWRDPIFWSFIGALFGGAVASFINGIAQRHLAQQTRRRDRLHGELTQLYGPIYYYVMQNKKLFEINARFHDAYKKELIDQKWATDADTQRSVSAIADTTLKIANEYIHEVEVNNTAIKNILDKNFALCDPKDMATFALFFEHFIRYKKEMDETRKLITPMQIYSHLGNISFMTPEFIQQIEARCAQKQREYLRLTS